MKSIRLVLYMLLPVTLFILFACERTYPDGETVEVNWWQKTIDVVQGNPPRKIKDKKSLTGDEVKDKEIKAYNEAVEKHNEGAKRDRENPDEGLLPAIGVLMTLLGYGTAKGFLNKKRLEGIREGLESENLILQAGYQEIKEGHREDEEALRKVKRLFSVGTHTARESIEVLKSTKDDIEYFKDQYKTVRKKV